MIAQSVAPIWSRAWADKIAAALGTNPAAALLPTPHLCLIGTPGLSLTPDTATATITATEATFSGYSETTGALSGAVNTGENSVGAIVSGLFSATVASPFVGDTIYGYYITDGTNWALAELWPTPLQLQIVRAGDFIELTISLPIPLYPAL